MIRGALLTLWLALLLVQSVCLADAPRGADRADTPRAARIKQHVREILSAPEYQWDKPQPSIFDPALRWLRDRWRNFTKWVSDRIESMTAWLGQFLPAGWRVDGRAGVAFVRFLAAILVAFLLFVLAYVLARALGSRGVRSRRDGPRIDQLAVAEEEAGHDPDAWLAIVRAYLSAGDLRNAYRSAFTATLLRLDQVGALRYDRSRTNGEYVRAVRRHPDVFSLLQPLALAFDVRWYGGRVVDPSDVDACLAAYDQVKAMAPMQRPA